MVEDSPTGEAHSPSPGASPSIANPTRGGELFYRDGAGTLVGDGEDHVKILAGTDDKPVPGGRIPQPIRHRGHDVAPDDQRFLMLRPLGATAPEQLIVVENWFEGQNAQMNAEGRGAMLPSAA